MRRMARRRQGSRDGVEELWSGDLRISDTRGARGTWRRSTQSKRQRRRWCYGEDESSDRGGNNYERDGLPKIQKVGEDEKEYHGPCYRAQGVRSATSRGQE
ncbi:hypothetical protein HPP92_011745 [Vanilla planifolia]|uniref:Uncharacterized protein n=1 Tax=Vanilla planifolia TaxID=51239 RepID=A0A835R6M1_VANPL|nr:hypothetical protein HPP92_011745 [Vanilla planifolia]